MNKTQAYINSTSKQLNKFHWSNHLRTFMNILNITLQGNKNWDIKYAYKTRVLPDPVAMQINELQTHMWLHLKKQRAKSDI